MEFHYAAYIIAFLEFHYTPECELAISRMAEPPDFQMMLWAGLSLARSGSHAALAPLEKLVQREEIKKGHPSIFKELLIAAQSRLSPSGRPAPAVREVARVLPVETPSKGATFRHVEKTATGAEDFGRWKLLIGMLGVFALLFAISRFFRKQHHLE